MDLALAGTKRQLKKVAPEIYASDLDI